MSRLDQHVSAVRTRMMLGVWLTALAWTGIVYAVVVLAAVLIYKLVQLQLPHEAAWFWAGLGVAVAASIVYAIIRRPTAQQAAVAIDERLALKEKFSTALFVRASNDPFAVAAVKDAERTATNVSLQKRFPVQFPRAGIGTIAATTLVFLLAWLLPTFDLFGMKQSAIAKSQAVEENRRQAQDMIHRAIAEIDAAPKSVAEKPEIQMAKRELLAMKGNKTADPETARSTGQKAIEQVQQAIKQKIQANKDFAVTQQEMQEFKNMTPPADEPGPIADAHRNLAQGKFDAAVQDLSKAVDNFNKLDPKEQDKAARQMDQLAKAIQKMANDPKVQQNLKQQMQNMGATQQQQQQMQNLLQQAAAGNQQASQQLQQLGKQLAQQMNQNGKMSAQQQRQMAQQIQKQLQQMQQKVNGQMNAQQLAGSAQALAQAMQQAAQGGNPAQPKQGNNGQMANQQQAGQQPGQQGKNGGQANKQQQMANAAKQMQQQMQQMQAVANDAQQVAAGQQNGAQGDGGEQGQGGKNGQNGQNGQANGQNGNGQGPWGQGQNQQQGQAMGGGPGVAAGNNRPAPAIAPYQTKNETDTQQRDEKGKVLASNFVKAGSLKGDAKLQLHDVLPPPDKIAADEVGEQRIPRQDQDVVRGYFGNVEKDAQK
ncbi:MAG TPA: hypothetical protein VGI81_15060 [Tepidisphaeraceae bacterium]